MGKEVPLGEPGEIVTRGPQVTKGYWPEPASGLTKDGWLHTGDIAVMDEDGYFHIHDMTKDMINVSGMAYSTSVEKALYDHPGVLMAVAISVPDLKILSSNRVMAIIRLKEDYKGKVTDEDIINSVKGTSHLIRSPNT